MVLGIISGDQNNDGHDRRHHADPFFAPDLHSLSADTSRTDGMRKGVQRQDRREGLIDVGLQLGQGGALTRTAGTFGGGIAGGILSRTASRMEHRNENPTAKVR